MFRCKAPEILRSIKPWAAPAVKFLPEDGPNGLSRGTPQLKVFQQPAKMNHSEHRTWCILLYSSSASISIPGGLF